MATRKDKGSWWVDFQVRGTRHRYRSPQNTREGALAFEALLRSELSQFGELRSVGHGKPTVEGQGALAVPTLKQFAPRWLEGYVVTNNRPKEAQQKKSVLANHLLPLYGNMRLDEITVEHIERYKGTKQREGLHPKTITNHLLILHKLLVTAKDWSIIQTVPHVKPLKSPDPSFRYLSRLEAEALIFAIPEGLLKTMVLTALRTGLRYSELSGLQWEDVDLIKKTVTVRRSIVEGEMGSTKNNRIRHIPLTEDASTALGKIPCRSGFVFQFHGLPVLYKTARVWLQESCRVAAVPVISWHDLRHTFASHLVASGAPLVSVQKLLGHADIKMTMRYAHLGPDELRNSIQLLEPPRRNGMSARRQPELVHIKNPA